MCIYCTFTAARLAAFLYNSVPSDRIKAALPLIALTKVVLVVVVRALIGGRTVACST